MARVAAEDQGELPGEVVRVSHPRAHALAHERRHGVRRVAGEKDPTDAPLAGEARLEGVDELADRFDVVACDAEFTEQLPGLFRVGEIRRVLGGTNVPFPSAVVLAEGKHRGRTARVADLTGVEVDGEVAFAAGVEDQPVLVEAEVLALDSEPAADAAVGAVAGDEVSPEQLAAPAGELSN